MMETKNFSVKANQTKLGDCIMVRDVTVRGGFCVKCNGNGGGRTHHNTEEATGFVFCGSCRNTCPSENELFQGPGVL